MEPSVAQKTNQATLSMGSVDAWRIVGYPLRENGTGQVELWRHVHEESGTRTARVILTSPKSQERCFFGWSVAIHRHLAAVSAPGGRAGAVYVFDRDQGGPNRWGLVARLRPDVDRYASRFGWSVAVRDGLVLIGAPGDEAAGYEAGAAYLYGPRGLAGEWELHAALRAPDAQDFGWFGSGVYLRDGLAIVDGRSWRADGADAWATYVFRLPIEAGPT